MRELLIFLVAGAGTYLARSVFILALGDRELSANAERALRTIAPAVLAALTVSLLTTDGAVAFLTDVPVLLGCAAGVAVGLWRKAFLGSFLAAVAVWWLAGLLI